MLGTLVSTLGLRVGRPLTMSAAPSPASGPLPARCGVRWGVGGAGGCGKPGDHGAT